MQADGYTLVVPAEGCGSPYYVDHEGLVGTVAEDGTIIWYQALDGRFYAVRRTNTNASIVRLLGMTEAAVRSAAWRGSLPVVRVGSRLRFRPSDLAGR